MHTSQPLYFDSRTPPLNIEDDRTAEQLAADGDMRCPRCINTPGELNDDICPRCLGRARLFPQEVMPEDIAARAQELAAMKAHRRRLAELKLVPDAHILNLFAAEGSPALGELPDVRADLTAREAFALITFAQLGLQHPQATGANAKLTREVLDGLARTVCSSVPVLAEVVRRGFVAIDKAHPPAAAPIKLYVPRDGE
jgi:hypothetical protein